VKKLLIILLVVFFFLAALSAFIALIQKDGISLGEKVALMRIEGPIFDSRDYVEELKKYAEDPSVKAIVLRVDSPGGAVAPSQEIYEEVKRAVEKKSVVASMGSVAASGGYYVLSPSTKILANPGTLTGSIGVIMEIPNVEGLMDKVGIKTQVIKSGKHKDIASVFREMTEEDRSILQGVLDDVHDQFISSVAETRNIPVDEVRKIADGRIYTGRQAVDIGLVDELGNLEDAIDLSAELAGIEGKPKVVSKKEKLSFFEMLRGKISAEFPEMFPCIRIKYMMTL
jgi:protease-4